MRHPIFLLTPMFYAAVLFGFCVWLTVHATVRDAGTFVLIGLVGALFFAYRAAIEGRQAWGPFTQQLSHLRTLRRAAPLTRINLPKDDVR